MGSKKPSNVNYIIKSLDDSSKAVDVMGGTPLIEYRESVFDHTIRIQTQIFDTGNVAPADDGSQGRIGLVDYLKLRGCETVEFKMTDAHGVSLDFGDSLRVNDISGQSTGPSQDSLSVELVSKELFDNKNSENNVQRRDDGLISDTVNRILTNDLKTERSLYIDATANTHSIQGLSGRPFDVILELQQLAKPTLGEHNRAQTAGYYFWQTAKGYHFQSPDLLLERTNPKKYILDYSSSPEDDIKLPAGFYDKILDWSIKTTVNVESQMDRGAIGGITVSSFDYPTLEFNSEVYHPSDNTEKIFNGSWQALYGEYSEMTTQGINIWTSKGNAWDTRDSIELQQEKATQPNIADSTVALAQQNYRERVQQIATATVPGDFSLSAGDIIYCEIPQTSTKTAKGGSINRNSGLYTILELCHYITPTKTYTGLLLGRDQSFGVKDGNSGGLREWVWTSS